MRAKCQKTPVSFVTHYMIQLHIRVDCDHGRCHLWCLLHRRLYCRSLRLRYDGSLRTQLSRWVDCTSCAQRSEPSSVPIDQTTIKTLYVFVEIGIDSSHLEETIRLNFPSDRQQFHDILLSSEVLDSKIPAGQRIGVSNHLQIEGPDYSDHTNADGLISQGSEHLTINPTRLALVSTIQFVAALSRLKEDLTSVKEARGVDFRPLELGLEAIRETDEPSQIGRPRLWTGKYDAIIPQTRPLSPGEILGCTAPHLTNVDALMFVKNFLT